MSVCQKCGRETEAGRLECPDCIGPGRISCPHCGCISSNTAKHCYYCNGDLSAAPSQGASDVHLRATSVGAQPPAGQVTPYGDAYSVSRAVISAGNAVKVVAGILVGAVLIASLIAADQFGGAAAVLGVIYAATIGASMYVLGVLLSAVGQILRATLDTAVNTSRISPVPGDGQSKQVS